MVSNVGIKALWYTKVFNCPRLYLNNENFNSKTIKKGGEKIY